MPTSMVKRDSLVEQINNYNKPHAHLLIIRRKSTKFQVNRMKDVGAVGETRSLGWTDGRTDIITNADG